MGTFNKDRLQLMAGSLAYRGAGRRWWYYTDTGIVGGDFSEGSTFFTTGYDAGMRRGDWIMIQEGDTGNVDTVAQGQLEGGLSNKGGNSGGHRTYVTTVYSAVDTGATQIVLNTITLLGDTS